jgi:putative NADH-flavin reductase
MSVIAIFGASGRTGQRLVRAALAHGHTVRALVRDAARLEAREGLTVVVGDVMHPGDVARAVAGADGALSALGGGTTAAPGDTRSRGVRHIVEALEAQGGGRIVALGGGGVLDATHAPGLRSEQPTFPAVFRHVTAEHRATWECLRASSLAWTYVCPPDIPDGDATGTYRVTADVMPDQPRALRTGDLAEFMVVEFSTRAFVGHRVGICS